MKVTVSQALILRAALMHCDGFQKIIKDGAAEKAVTVFYDLGFSTRLKIAKNIAILDSVNDTHVKMRDAIIKDLSQNGISININDHPDKFVAFNNKEQDLLAQEIEVELERFSSDDFAQSLIPASVLSKLLLIIDR